MHMQGCTKWIIPSREEQGFLNGESARQQSFLRPFPIKWFAFLTVHGGERVDGDTDAHRTLLDLAGSSLRAGRQTQAKAFTLFHVCCNVLASFSPYVFTHHFNWSSLSIYLLCDYWRIWVFIYQFTTCFLSTWPACFMFFLFLLDFVWVKQNVIPFSLFYWLVNSFTRSVYPRDYRAHASLTYCRLIKTLPFPSLFLYTALIWKSSWFLTPLAMEWFCLYFLFKSLPCFYLLKLLVNFTKALARFTCSWRCSSQKGTSPTYGTETVVNNIVMTVDGARGVLEISGGTLWKYMIN